MAVYEVWGSNSVETWDHLLLETDDREEAKKSAERAVEGNRYRWVAIDERGKTFWTNDPRTHLTA